MTHLRKQMLQLLRAVSIVYHQLNQRRARLPPGGVQRRLQRVPVFRAMVLEAEHGGGVFELHVLRHQIEALTLALRRRQQRENLPAVIVHNNQHERGRRPTQERQRVEIVEG